MVAQNGKKLDAISESVMIPGTHTMTENCRRNTACFSRVGSSIQEFGMTESYVHSELVEGDGWSKLLFIESA